MYNILKNKKWILTFAILFLAHGRTMAARVGVTDSGTDFSHEWLKDKALINQDEKQGNLVDDDRNGKVDDIVGWNFVEDYRKIFFPDHLKIVDEQLFKIFEVISRVQSGTQTEEDKKFLKENIQDLEPSKKQALVAKLNFYGQYAHSTHVSGIISAIAPESRIMSNRVFPDTPPDIDGAKVKSFSENTGIDLNASSEKKSRLGVVDIFYKVIAAITNGSFEKVAQYTAERHIDVSNYSLGISLQTIAKMILGVKGIKTPTPEQLSAETRRIASQYEPVGRKWMNMSPQTLFVVAAGNDHSDNDLLPVFPAIVKTENSLIVAATKGNSALADFSNFGEKSVDIAAPGVAIVSSVPSIGGKKLLPMSGTSMAAPYVTGVVANVKDVNPKLNPGEMKQILMGTVDVKDWLKNKVISSGVINPARAYFAAEKAKVMDINQAIALAKHEVADLPTVSSTTLKGELKKVAIMSVSKGVPVSEEIKNIANDLVF